MQSNSRFVVSNRIKLGLFASLLLPLLAPAGEAFEIGSRRELFVDRFLIDCLRGAELRLHEHLKECS